MKKIGRNDKCSCGSNKKYKICCLQKHNELKLKENEKYSFGQNESSDKIKICLDYFKNQYKDHKVIDISNDLNTDNYKTYQIKNYTNKIIMIAERNEINKEIFTQRSQNNENIIILYRGSYRLFYFGNSDFNSQNFDSIKRSIDKMILTRLEGKDDK